MTSLTIVKTFDEFISESDDMSTAWGSYVKYMKTCYIGYDINNAARQKALLLLHGGKTLENFHIGEYVPPALLPNQVEK